MNPWLYIPYVSSIGEESHTYYSMGRAEMRSLLRDDSFVLSNKVGSGEADPNSKQQ